jgi:outer membrane protein assembly factor BamB
MHARLRCLLPSDAFRAARLSLVAALGLFLAVAAVLADDWPGYARDASRSCRTPEKITLPLDESWTFRPEFPPAPAWGDPKEGPVEGILELRRVHFDDAFHVAVAEGRVYFGSSADHKVYCLDAATGRPRWTKITGGAIRLAPWLVGGRVYVGSDDGHVYCLNAADGAVVWDFRAAPDDRRVLGHGRMVSLWPVRTGVLVDDGLAYFAAGIFPAEGVFFYAVDAATGKQVWCNDSSGETPQSRVSPQGYLLASKTTLYAPMGRVSPAALDRKTGQLLGITYFGKPVGGTNTLLDGEQVYTGTEQIVGYQDKRRLGDFPARKLVLDGPRAYLATGKQLVAVDRKSYPAVSRKLIAVQSKSLRLENVIGGLRKTRGELKHDVAQLEAELKEAKPGERETVGKELDTKRQQLATCQKRLDAETASFAGLGSEAKRYEAEAAQKYLWSTATASDQALIQAGGVLLAGGRDLVEAFDTRSGKMLWSAKVDGLARGLAFADGRLYVSTDRGLIYCYAHGVESRPSAVVERTPPASQRAWQTAAETILQQTGIRRGYCLVLGCDDGQLAVELARRSDLTIYAVSADAAKVAAARSRVEAAGLYGGRISVEQWPLDKVPYADYFANLVVSQSAAADGQLPDAGEMFRMLKPVGGVALIGQPALGGRLTAERLNAWLAEAKLDGARVVSDDGLWARVDRGPLAGAGSWTHQYGEPGNTACGDDQLIRAPLGVLWFGYPGPKRMMNRHTRAAAPLSADGRMYCEGENCILAYDAYNGLPLWERDLPGAFRPNASHDGSNMALSRHGLLVGLKDTCVRLDLTTGETLATYALPPAAGPRRWGVVACVGDLLYGTRALEKSIESDQVFAIDLTTGRQRWAFTAKGIPHGTLSIDQGRVFLVDREVTPDERREVVEQSRARVAELPEAEQPAARRALKTADVRRVVALDADTGMPVWQRVVDVSFCGAGNLAAMTHRGVLLLFGVYLDGHYWKDFFAGQFASRRVVALSARDGSQLWSQAMGYLVRPVIVGDTLHAEPWAFDLASGKPVTRVNPITGQTEKWQFARPGHHCGCSNAAPNCLFFRSFCFGYYDLQGDYGTMHFGAQRPGCWINFIPANGLVLMPEGSSGCMCPFPNMCSVVFQPAPRPKGFAWYSASGPSTPVQRLAIHFGAPGDRKDAQGNLWLGYPRPGGSLVLPMRLEVAYAPGGGPVLRNSTYTPIAGTDDPWLYAAAARGISSCTLPLLERGDGKSLYRVRLALCDPDNDKPRRRVFDVKIQGRTVLSGCDIVRETGARDRALVKEFDGIEVTDNLKIEFVSAVKKPTPERAPIVQGIEVVRQKVLGLGCLVPEFELSESTPRATGEIRLGNIRDVAFAGRLEIQSPADFEVTPASRDVTVEAGQRVSLPLELAVRGKPARGVYTVQARLLRSDGSQELSESIRVEYLGSRNRVVLRAAEDATVLQRYSEINRGTTTTLGVDGGERKMGDLGHTLSYLKFLVDVPGKPVSLRLRLTASNNPSVDAGRVCLVDGPWGEESITYSNRPALGRELARLGNVGENETIERVLNVDMAGQKELSLAIDPTSCDGLDFLSREGAHPPELIVEYEP